jgi:cytochrome c-type biogenesis protein CcmE
VDLTPRPVDDTKPLRSRRTRGRRLRSGIVLAMVLLAVGVILFQGLSNATLYFYNADEAVAQKADLGTKRFRLQGKVEPGTIVATTTGTRFEVGYNGVTVEVDHAGDPPDLFQACLPVVVEGHWSGDVFASDRIMVKHSNEYATKNPDRVEAGCP